MDRKKKFGIWLVCGLLVGAIVPVSIAIALSGDSDPEGGKNTSEPTATSQTTTAPEATAFEDPSIPGFYGKVPEGLETSIILTDKEVATLKSEDYAASRIIYDEKLVPVMNAVVTALLANGGSAEGLNFSNVLNDKNTISQMEELVAPYVHYGKVNLEDQTLQLCDTQPNEDGSRNFCGPLQTSRLNLNENTIWDIYASNVDDTAGEEISLHTAMQPRIYVNKLIVATDGAIRSDF